MLTYSRNPVTCTLFPTCYLPVSYSTIFPLRTTFHTQFPVSDFEQQKSTATPKITVLTSLSAISIHKVYLELTSLCSFLDGDCESSKIEGFSSFWGLHGAYTDRPTPTQDRFVPISDHFSSKSGCPVGTSELYLNSQGYASPQYAQSSLLAGVSHKWAVLFAFTTSLKGQTTPQ